MNTKRTVSTSKDPEIRSQAPRAMDRVGPQEGQPLSPMAGASLVGGLALGAAVSWGAVPVVLGATAAYGTYRLGRYLSSRPELVRAGLDALHARRTDEAVAGARLEADATPNPLGSEALEATGQRSVVQRAPEGLSPMDARPLQKSEAQRREETLPPLGDAVLRTLTGGAILVAAGVWRAAEAAVGRRPAFWIFQQAQYLVFRTLANLQEQRHQRRRDGPKGAASR